MVSLVALRLTNTFSIQQESILVSCQSCDRVNILYRWLRTKTSLIKLNSESLIIFESDHLTVLILKPRISLLPDTYKQNSNLPCCSLQTKQRNHVYQPCLSYRVKAFYIKLALSHLSVSKSSFWSK